MILPASLLPVPLPPDPPSRMMGVMDPLPTVPPVTPPVGKTSGPPSLLPQATSNVPTSETQSELERIKLLIVVAALNFSMNCMRGGPAADGRATCPYGALSTHTVGWIEQHAIAWMLGLVFGSRPRLLAAPRPA